MKLVSLTPDHVSLLADLHQTMDLPWESPWSEQSYGELLQQPSTEGIAFFDKDILASFALYQSTTDSIDLLYVVTAYAYRRQGLATKLVKIILETHPEHKIFLDVCEKNTPALDLYKNLAFREISRRKNYYQGETSFCSDAIVLVYDGHNRS